MDARGKLKKRLCALILSVALVVPFVWSTPAGAIKVERTGSEQTPEKEKQAPAAKESGDSARTPTRSLLDNVESQKKTESARDSLDTWIDRDGDGVNDKMKKPPAHESRRVKSLVPPTVKKRAPAADPKEKEEEPKSADDSTVRKRRR